MITYTLADAAACFQNAQQAVGVIDYAEHGVWFANSAFVRATYSLHVHTSCNPLTEWPPLQQRMRECMEHQALAVYESPDGLQRWECLPVQVLQADGSTALGVQCTVLPLAVDKPPEATSGWQRMLEQSPLSQWACSLSGEVYWTNQASNLYCYGHAHRPDLNNSRHIHKIHPDDMHSTTLQYSKAMAQGYLAAPIRYRLRDHTGVYRWFLMTAAPVRDAQGSILHWVGASTDIDDLISQEQALQAHIQQLSAQCEQLQARLSASQALLANVHKMDLVAHLAGGVAHDLNNLLFVQGIHLSVLQKNTTDTTLLERLHAIRDCSRKAARLSTQISGFSGRLPQNATALSPAQVLHDLHDLLRQAAGAETDFQLVVEEGLHNIHADRSYLENALLNLVINARDAAEGRGQVRLQVRNHRGSQAGEPQDCVAFSVHDNGRGMDSAVQARIFEPFFTTKGPGKGTGLGLPMVKNFVDSSHGWMDVQSAPGQGSVLTLYLPQSTLAVEACTTTEETLPPGRAAVMLIEDDPSVRQAVSSFLCELGYGLSIASDPTQAMILLGNGVQVDAIVSDVKMPGQKTVLDLIQYVETHRPVPIIFNTGYSADIAISEGLIAGRYPVLFKPFAISELATLLREALDAAPAAPAADQA